jgi:hypothetical protein
LLNGIFFAAPYRINYQPTIEALINSPGSQQTGTPHRGALAGLRARTDFCLASATARIITHFKEPGHDCWSVIRCKQAEVRLAGGRRARH